MISEKTLKALSFGEHCGIKRISFGGLEEMEICLNAAIEDFNSATEEQINNEESYQYFCAWCNEKLSQEFCDSVLKKIV